METSNWNISDIPDLSGITAIVTGSSSGLGFEDVKALAGKNAKVIIAVRNLEKGYNALNKIKSIHPLADIQVKELDLANLSSIITFANSFKNEIGKLDLLINNAGVMAPPYSKTKDGFELQFGTNHLGHFALTAKLFPLIKASSYARIVNVSSSAHQIGKLDFSDLNYTKRKYSPWRAYGRSKIANLYFTYELDRQLKAVNSHVKVYAAHPGWSVTELQRHSGFSQLLNPFFAQSSEMGALTTLYAATSDKALTGGYYGPGGFLELRGFPKLVSSNSLSHDNEIAKKLWSVSEELTKTKFII